MENLKTLLLSIICLCVLVGSFMLTIKVLGVATFVVFPVMLMVVGMGCLVFMEVKEHLTTNYTRPEHSKQFK